MKSLRMFAAICAAVSVCSLSVSAEVFPNAHVPVGLYDGEEDPEGALIYYNRESGVELPADFVIPSEFEGKPVYGIADDGFSGRLELVHVTVPDTVVLIGQRAFGSCTNLQRVDLPSSLVGIDDYAFSHCSSLTSIVLPDSVTNLGTAVFSSSGLQSVTFSQNLDTMGQATFLSCDSLTEVSLPASLKKVQSQTFRNCKNLKTATVAGPVCAELMFGDCPKLESVTILDPACEICGYGSTICNEVTEVARGRYDGVIRGYKGSTAEEYAKKWNYRFEPLDPDTPPEIDYSKQPVAFGADHKYTADGIVYEYMGDHVRVCGFDSGKVPQTLAIQRGIAGVPVTEIAENAFSGMTGAEFVTVPMSVSEIGTGAFTQCPDLKEIRLYNPDVQISSEGPVFSNDNAGSFTGVLVGYVPSNVKGYTAFREMIFLELEQVKGDVILDGKVSIDDAQTALKIYTETVAGKTPAVSKIQQSTADVDGNKTISVEDAQLILKYYTETSVAGREISWDELLKK